MKKLLMAGALLVAVASTQAATIYWEGNDSWNGNIGSTDYVDGQAWSLDPAYGPYGLAGPQDGDTALIGNWGQAGTAATQPILSVAATGSPAELRIGGSDGSVGTLDILAGGSVAVGALNISYDDGVNHGNGTLNVSGGYIVGSNMELGTSLGFTGTINLSAGTVHLGAAPTIGANGTVNLSPGALFLVNGDQEGAAWLSSFVAVDGGTGISAVYDGSAQTAITAIPEPATLGLFAIFGGAALFIRKKIMI